MWWRAVVLGVVQLALLAAQPSQPSKPPESTASDKPTAKAPQSDHLPVPSGAIIVVAEDLKHALNLAGPGAVVLTAERYQTLVEQAARAEKAAQAERTDVLLSICRLSGQVIRDADNRELADLQIALEFRTQAANALIPIGLKGVKLTKAMLDGEVPLWGPERNGLTVQIKDPKVCQLVLQVQLPVVRTSAERKILLEHLPAAAITTLNFTIPERVQSAAVKGAGPISVAPGDGTRSQLHSDALGVLEQLELTWQTAPGPGLAAEPSASVSGDLRVTLAEGTIDTDARLRVEAKQGSLTALRFSVAPNTEVLQIEDELRNEALVWEPHGPTNVVTVQLKQPLTPGDSAFALRMRLQNKFAAKPGTSVAVGQCELQEPKPINQGGTIAVFIAPELRGVRWQHANMHRTDPKDLSVAENRSADLAYRYWQQPVRLEAFLDPPPPPPPILEVRAVHTLHFTGAALALACEFEIQRISRAGVQEIEIRWPKGWTLSERRVLPAMPVEFDSDAATSAVRARFSARPAAPFKIKLEGILPIAGQKSAALAIPNIAQAFSERSDRKENAHIILREGEVRIIPEDLEVWLRSGTSGLFTEGYRLPEPDLPLTGPATFTLEPRASDRPWQLALGWQPRRLDAISRAEVYLTSQEMHVEQTLRFQFSGSPPAQIGFRLPPDASAPSPIRLSYPKADGTTVAREIRWNDAPQLAETAEGERAVVLPQEAHGSCTLTWKYRKALAIASGEAKLLVPLLQARPAEIAQASSEVRVWASTSLQVQGPGPEKAWQPFTSTALGGTDLLPNLELHATGADTPLELVCRPVEPSATADAIADRVLCEVQGLAHERWTVRARFWFSRLRSDSLRLSLPGAAPTLVVEKVLLNQLELPAERVETTVNNPGQQTRLQAQIPALYLAQPALLEVRYQYSNPDKSGWRSRRVVPAPTLDGNVVVRTVRWRVEWPSGWLPLSHGDWLLAEQSWQFLGGLWPPPPTPLADEMEQWLLPGSQRTHTSEERPALGFTQLGTLQSLEIMHAPRQTWLLAWSLVVLFAGVAAFWLSRRVLLVAGGLLLVAIILLGVWAPDYLTAIVFGAQPGLLVIAATWAVLWLRQRRWRRQVVMLPGFSRLKSGSSLVRSSSSSPRPQREPSTAEASPASPVSPPAPAPAESGS
jgi:hypothetical protein